MSDAPETAYLVLMGLYVLYALARNLRKAGPEDKRFKTLVIIAQLPVVALACYFGARQGVFSRQLVSPLWIGAGLVAGHIVFALSSLATHHSWEHAAAYFKDFASLWKFVTASPVVLSRYLWGSVAEEMIYRVGAQPLCVALMVRLSGHERLGGLAGLLLVALCFCVVHEHFFKNTFWVSLEFTGFALLLGTLYYLTASVILVVVIHAVRNIEVAYLEFLIRAEELGDEEQALAEIEADACLRTQAEHS